jgi:hypothetical protein
MCWCLTVVQQVYLGRSNIHYSKKVVNIQAFFDAFNHNQANKYCWQWAWNSYINISSSAKKIGNQKKRNQEQVIHVVCSIYTQNSNKEIIDKL